MSFLHARGPGKGQKALLPSSRAHGAQADTNAILQAAFAHVDTYHLKGTDATDEGLQRPRVEFDTHGDCGRCTCRQHEREPWPAPNACMTCYILRGMEGHDCCDFSIWPADTHAQPWFYKCMATYSMGMEQGCASLSMH